MPATLPANMRLLVRVLRYFNGCELKKVLCWERTSITTMGGCRRSASGVREGGSKNRFHKYPKYAFSSPFHLLQSFCYKIYGGMTIKFYVVVLSGWWGGWLVGILYTKVHFVKRMKIPWLTLTDCLCTRRSHRNIEYLLLIQPLRTTITTTNKCR